MECGAFPPLLFLRPLTHRESFPLDPFAQHKQQRHIKNARNQSGGKAAQSRLSKNSSAALDRGAFPSLSNRLPKAPALQGSFKRFDHEEDFGGPGVVQIRRFGEGGVTAAGNDGLEGLDETGENSSFEARTPFFQKRGGGISVAGEERLGQVMAEPARWVVILAAEAPVGEIGSDGFAFRFRSVRRISSGQFDFGENVPRPPRFRGKAELCLAFEGQTDFLPRFIETTEVAERVGKTASGSAFIRHVPSKYEFFHSLPIERGSLYGTVQDIVIKDPQLR
jgi:hypothetical protein